MKLQFNIIVNNLDTNENQLNPTLKALLTYLNIQANVMGEDNVKTCIIDDMGEYTTEYRVTADIKIDDDDVNSFNLNKITELITQLQGTL